MRNKKRKNILKDIQLTFCNLLKDKQIRMEGIGKEIQKGEYDVYLLQELWMKADHARVRSFLPQGDALHGQDYKVMMIVVAGFFMTEFTDLSSSSCDGVVSPYNCSGLAVVSKYQIQDVSYMKGSQNGAEIMLQLQVGQNDCKPPPP